MAFRHRRFGRIRKKVMRLRKMIHRRRSRRSRFMRRFIGVRR